MRRRTRRGLGLAEVVVCLAIVGAAALLVIMALPRGRSSARVATCRRNLMQIGVATAVYAQQADALPAVPALDASGPSPLLTLLRGLGQDNFDAMADPSKPPPKRGAGPPAAGYLSGLTCPADRSALSTFHPAPISYRAVAGPGPEGVGGPFAPGRSTTVREIQQGDGAGHTLGFVERLVGGGSGGSKPRGAYRRVAGPVGDGACGEGTTLDDAGSSWGVADWRSTLANFALTPNAGPSCIAADGRTARISASSGHSGLAHGLLLDGSVRAFTDRIDREVWRRWSTVRGAAPAPPT